MHRKGKEVSGQDDIADEVVCTAGEVRGDDATGAEVVEEGD